MLIDLDMHFVCLFVFISYMLLNKMICLGDNLLHRVDIGSLLSLVSQWMI